MTAADKLALALIVWAAFCATWPLTCATYHAQRWLTARWQARLANRAYVPSVAVMSDLLGIEWMSEKGLQLSIPPIYAQWIGEQILTQLEQEAAA